MLKVLVVEDEELIRKGIILTVDWASLDCVVVGEAANGEEALEAVERFRPSLIITDLKMPRMDGIELLRRLREQGSRAYVIILTAYDSFTYAQSALRLGGGGLSPKALPRRRSGTGRLQSPAEDDRRVPRPHSHPARTKKGGQEPLCPGGHGLYQHTLQRPRHRRGLYCPVPWRQREPSEPHLQAGDGLHPAQLSHPLPHP